MKIIRVLLPTMMLSLSIKADYLTSPEHSIFQVIVTGPDGGIRSGSAFAFHLDGEHPTFAYLLTAAHVILGDAAKDNTLVHDAAKSVTVRFGPAQGDFWDLDIESIRVATDWKSSGRDFAILRVNATDRNVVPIPLTFQSPPSTTAFEAYGFPGDFTVVTPLQGRTSGVAGANNPYLWIVADVTLPQGMSGGPTLMNGKVFAIAEGWPLYATELKYLAPLSVARSFFLDVPNFNLPTYASRFELHAYVTRRRLVSTTQEPFESRNAQINVGCQESKTDIVSYTLAPDVTLINGFARWDGVDNIKSQEVSKSLVNGTAVIATGKIVGLDTQLFNCPGGGHASLVLSGVISRRLTTVDNTVVEVGASELADGATTFSLPPGDTIEALRVDLRPLGSTQGFGSINVFLRPTSNSGTEQVLFGRRFRVSANSLSLKIEQIPSEGGN